ncbi:hypothetical protein F5Y05DRAFT_70032 [Hypoxylon sp. FL0543]|nr:hypothetical protein F5Y05DRAFT_70032 [Hypoxylon sp. FL0543]
MLPFYLDQFFAQFEEAGEESDTTPAPPYETVLCPSASCPANPCGCPGPRSPAGPGDAEHSAAVIADLNEQLRKARLQVENLEQEVNSNSEVAERIVDAMLHRIWRLRVSLTRSEERRENEAAKHKQASERVHMLIHTLCENKSDSKCQDSYHQELATALEDSNKAAAEAIQNAEAREREVSALRDELMVAEKIVSDERSLSHVVSQQVEGMERILNIQHAEIKEQKATIADLNQVISVLHAENDDLMAKKEASSGEAYVDRGIGGEVHEAKSEVTKLERRIAELEEQKSSLQTRLDEERDAQRATRRYNTALKGKLAATVFSINQCEQGIATLRDSLHGWTEYMRHTEKLQDSQVQNPPTTTPKSATNENKPPLEPNAQGQTAVPTTLQDELEELKQKNRDLEAEMQELRHVSAKLTGFHPLKRVQAHDSLFRSPLQPRLPKPTVKRASTLTSFPPLVKVEAHGSLPEPPPATPAGIKSSLLHMPEGYEDIPELRLPSPIASIKSQSQSQSQVKPELRLTFGSGGKKDTE